MKPYDSAARRETAYDEGALALGNTKLLSEYRTLVDAARLDAQNPERHVQLGRFYLRIGHRTRAYSALRAAKALSPRYLVAYRLLGRMYQEDGEQAAARDTYLQLLQYEPGTAEMHFELGRIYQHLDEIPLAVSALAEAVRLDPNLTQAYELLADLALAAGEHERALTYLNHLKGLKPRSARIYRLTAAAHQQNGHTDRAVLDLKHAMGLAPQDPAVRGDLAQLYLEEGLPRQTLDVLGPLLKERPSPESALLQASRAHRDLGESELAESYLATALEHDPLSVEANLARARLRQTRGDLEGAEEFFRAAATGGADALEPMLELAGFFVKRERFDKARQLYLELAEGHETDRRIPLELARIEARRGDQAAALAAYARVLELDPEHAVAMRERARIFLQDGRFDDAMGDLDTALKIDPDGSSKEADLALVREHQNYREAFELHGEVVRALSRGDYEAARSQLEEILGLVPDNPRWLGDLADVCRVLGDFDAARKHLRKLVAMDEKASAPRRNLADLQYRLGHWDEASKRYEELVDRDEGDLSSRVRVLRTLRHRLVERTVSPDSFQMLEEAYRQNLGDTPSLVRTRLELAYLHLGMGSHLFEPKIWTSAVETHLHAISNALPEEPERVQAVLARLELARFTDDPAGVEAAAVAWVKIAPDDPDAAYVHLLALRGQGKVRAGRTQAQAYSRRFPGDGRFYHEWFRFLREELSDTPDGTQIRRERLREVQRRAGSAASSAQTSLELGFAHLHLTDDDQRLDGLSLASAAFKRSADLDPDTPWPWWGGVLTVSQGVEAAQGSAASRTRAVGAAKAAVRRFPRDPYLLYLYGKLALEGASEPLVAAEGRKALERALAQGPRPFAPAHALLGRDAAAQGDKTAAYHHLLKVFEEPEGLLEDARTLVQLRDLGAG